MATELEGTPPIPADLVERLEDAEARAASGRVISPWSVPVLPFWEQLADVAVESGGLRVHDPFGLCPPLLAFLPLVRPVVVLHLSAPRSAGLQSLPVSSTPKFLVWHNPLGEPALPEARAEAEAIAMQIQRAGFEAEWSSLPMQSGELLERTAEVDAVVYTGHGIQNAGALAVRCADRIVDSPEWLSGPHGPEVFFFGGCLEERSSLRNWQGPLFVGPECRIADRACRLMMDTISGWLLQTDLYSALGAAMQSNANEEDCRWRTVRLQGNSTLANRKLSSG